MNPDYLCLAAVLAAASCAGAEPVVSRDTAPTSVPTAEPAVAAGATTTPPSTPAPEPEPTGTLMEQLMKSHFVQVAKIRKAVIDGKIDNAIEPARIIVEMQGVDTLPEVWRSSVRELQAASDRIRQSPDLPEAASAAADIGMTCGGCHVVTAGPDIVVSEPPPDDGSLPARMQQHLWASERLWEGLYGPSDAAWRAGAKALQTTPFPKGSVDGVHARALAGRIVSLGKKAQTTTDPEARARIYATYLGTCAACHEKVR